MRVRRGGWETDAPGPAPGVFTERGALRHATVAMTPPATQSMAAAYVWPDTRDCTVKIVSTS